VPPKQKQPDLSSWDLLNDFTIDEAACLWVGIDPTIEESKRSQPETSKLVPIGYLLTKAVEEEKLPTIRLKPNRYSKALFDDMRVTREDLKVFAESIGAQPAFLFNISRPKVGGSESLSAKSKAGRDPLCSREVWLERLIILYLNKKFDLSNAQDAIAEVLREDLQKIGIEVKASTIKRNWIGSIVRKAKDESK
jgi:hypothetical protein